MTGQVDEAGREQRWAVAYYNGVSIPGGYDVTGGFGEMIHRLMAEADRENARLAGQVAAIRALCDEIEAATSECGAWWMAREMGLERPERQHYPDEGWSFCDGCSAAQAGDYDSKAIVARVRAALVASSPTTPEAKK